MYCINWHQILGRTHLWMDFANCNDWQKSSAKNVFVIEVSSIVVFSHIIVRLVDSTLQHERSLTSSITHVWCSPMHTAYVCTYVRTYMNTFTDHQVNTCMHAYTYVRMHTYVRTYVHTTHAHACKPHLPLLSSLSLCSSCWQLRRFLLRTFNELQQLFHRRLVCLTRGEGDGSFLFLWLGVVLLLLKFLSHSFAIVAIVVSGGNWGWLQWGGRKGGENELEKERSERG